MQLLAELEHLGRNWDGYGAEPVTILAISRARELIRMAASRCGQLVGAAIRPDGVSPLVDGGVQVEWSGSRSRIEVEVGPGGDLRCILDHGRDASPRITEVEHASLEDALQMILRMIAPAL